MSYCVNCGVKLEASIKKCPLCSTPVINPRELEKTRSFSPYPGEKGQVEEVKKKDIAILISVVLLTTAVVCGLLNSFALSGTRWSLPVIGICGILWVYSVPFLLWTKLPLPLYFLFDGCAIGIYLYVLTFLIEKNEWFWRIGLPIVVLVTILVEIMTWLLKKFGVSILFTALVFFLALPVLCIGIECFVDLYLYETISLFWSAVVLTVCVILDITLITVLAKKRLRNAIRKRLHF